MRYLPGVLAGIWGGVLADRADRRAVMLVTDVVMAVLAVAFLLADTPGRLWLVYPLTFASAAAGFVFQAARNAWMPSLVRPGEYPLYSAAVQVNATVRKTSAGAADSIPVIPATNLSRTLRDLQQMGVWIYGLAGEAETSFWSIDLRGNVALVLGGESDGLRRLTRENCDQLVKIPMPGAGDVESLNVSVASGVTLFEAVRQRHG